MLQCVQWLPFGIIFFNIFKIIETKWMVFFDHESVSLVVIVTTSSYIIFINISIIFINISITFIYISIIFINISPFLVFCAHYEHNSIQNQLCTLISTTILIKLAVCRHDVHNNLDQIRINLLGAHRVYDSTKVTKIDSNSLKLTQINLHQLTFTQIDSNHLWT